MAAHRIGIANQKGGVGKTTTAVNLAVSLSMRGHRVLLIDYDPQGNSTMALGCLDLTEAAGTFTSAEFTLARPPPWCPGPFDPQRDMLELSSVSGGRLDLLPSSEELAFLENDLVLRQDFAVTSCLLRRALDQVEADYDFILVDSGPTLGVLMLNVLAACRNIIVPVKLSPLSVPGALRLRDHVEKRIAVTLDPGIRIFGVLGTFMRESSRKPREVLARLRDIFGARVFDTVINESQAADDASETGRPVCLSRPGARASVQYDLLTNELLARIGRA
jgi:chromosome partitioning protein